jgi:hypothetical protein
MSNTQLTQVEGFDRSRIIFHEATKDAIPNTEPPVYYKRVILGVKNTDGTTGDLVFPTSRVFSFGVSQNTDPTSGKLNGYVLALCLWDKEGATAEEKALSDALEEVGEACKDYLIENKDDDSLELYDLERAQLKKLNPLHWKRVKGKIVDGFGPTLYAKLISFKKKGDINIISKFYNTDGEEVNPLEYEKTYSFVQAAVKIESIFIGNSITLQVKIYEAVIERAGGSGGLNKSFIRPARQVAPLITRREEDEDLRPTDPGPSDPPKKKVVRRKKKDDEDD